MKLFFLKVSLLALIIIQYACNNKETNQPKESHVTSTVDSSQDKATTTTVLKVWPLDVFLGANHSLKYEGNDKGEAEKYYSNAKSEDSFADTTLIVFKKYLVLITKNPEDGKTYYAVYDFIPGLIDTSKSRINLPVFPQARCRFAYFGDEMTHLQSIWKDKLYMVSSPEDIVGTLDIYDLKNCTVKNIANETESIADGLSIRGDSLYLFKINNSSAYPVKINDTLYNKEEEYVINLNNFKESKTGKDSMVVVD